MWQRKRDRTARLTERAVAEAARMVAGRGFSMPQGTLVRLIQQAIAEGLNKDAEDSRTVMIKQATSMQQNMRFAFHGRHAGGHADLALQSGAGPRAGGGQVRLPVGDRHLQRPRAAVHADVQAFGMKAQVFKVRLEAALAQLEIFKARIEGQRLVGEVNKLLVDTYIAQLTGVKTIAEVYRTRVDAVKSRIEADMAQVEIFRARIRRYDSQVKAKSSEYEGFATELKAEMMKVELFSAQLGASTLW
jgi:hypothetical protein